MELPDRTFHNLGAWKSADRRFSITQTLPIDVFCHCKAEKCLVERVSQKLILAWFLLIHQNAFLGKRGRDWGIRAHWREYLQQRTAGKVGFFFLPWFVLLFLPIKRHSPNKHVIFPAHIRYNFLRHMYQQTDNYAVNNRMCNSLK